MRGWPPSGSGVRPVSPGVEASQADGFGGDEGGGTGEPSVPESLPLALLDAVSPIPPLPNLAPAAAP